MQLHVESDASYLSETEARSRAGGIHFFRDIVGTTDKSVVNGAIECISCIIPSVVASAFEAEYAALFLNGQMAEVIRATLDDLGYPQKATPMISDNSCAVGTANKEIKQRKSKAIDMRYHWIRDRVKQGHFQVTWKPGETNLADFFTKAHPVQHHKLMRSSYVNTPMLTTPRVNASFRRKEKRIANSKGVLVPLADTLDAPHENWRTGAFHAPITFNASLLRYRRRGVKQSPLI
jgi:hypothetical protein